MREVTFIQAQTHGDFRRRDCSLRQATASVMLLLLSVAFPSSSAVVSFEENHEHVYENAPEIKVRGSGFETLIDSELEISFPKMMPRYNSYFLSPSYPGMERGALYEWDISSDTVITLKLTRQQTRWLGDQRMRSGQFSPLSIASVKAGGIELLDKRLTIATLMPSPMVISSNNVIYAESTPGFEIKGRFFNKSSEKNTLFFDPPLPGASEVLTQVHSSGHCSIIIAKRVGQWAAEPRPLILVGIDTGHGYLHVDSRGIAHASIPEDVGLVVADVQVELGKTGITVEPEGTPIIYQSTKRIQVSGTGFKPSMKLRFSGHGCGGGANYNITDLQPETFTLELMEGSKWCKAAQINGLRPARLVLLAADAGQGWVPLGPTVDKKYGQTIAHVLEDPSIQPSFTQKVSSRMFHTQANHLVIQGTGFRSPVWRTDIALEFEPPLVKESGIARIGSNYVVIQSASLQWTTEGYVGPLSVKGMDAGAGMVVFEPPVQVATIVERIVKDFAVDGHITHQVVDETCSALCLDLSWDAMVDGNDGTCVCDEPRHISSTSSLFLEEELEWSGEISYMGGYERGEVYDTTCDILCHHQDEWDGYNYQGKWVCLCGSGNELSTVGGDWFDEDGWHWMSHKRGHPSGSKNKNIIDEDAPKKRIWRKISNRHKLVFDDMAFAQRKKMFWDLTLFLGGSASCGVGVLLCTFLSRRIRSRRRA